MEALLYSEIHNNIRRSSINDLSSFSSPSSYAWPIITSSTSSSPTIMDKFNIPTFDWDLSLSAVVPAASTGSDAIGAIEFDPSGEILATGGIARKIRSYRLSSLLLGSSDDHVTTTESCICTPAKISSLKWRPDLSGRVIGSADYDGVVTEYDVVKGVPVFERDEHGGRRIWSVDYSLYSGSVIGVSGSDDGTAQTWDPRNGQLEETVRPGGGAAICSVEFDPFGGHSLAVGCADRNAYVYDIRRFVNPIVVLDGHAKTVTYARFMDQHTVVTGSTDGSVKLWDIANGRRVVRTCRGHVNSRNFVGLSVWRHGGLVVSGSENNQVFVYDKRWEEPVWVRGLGQENRFGTDMRFVSSVCWKQVDDDCCTLVAGGSDGVLEIFSGKRS